MVKMGKSRHFHPITKSIFLLMIFENFKSWVSILTKIVIWASKTGKSRFFNFTPFEHCALYNVHTTYRTSVHINSTCSYIWSIDFIDILYCRKNRLRTLRDYRPSSKGWLTKRGIRRAIRETLAPTDDSVLDQTKRYTWPYKTSANMDGEITLGGLHMVHERNEELTCGPIMAQGGIQAMETMLFTIDHVNKQPWWIKNVTLGITFIFSE